MATKDTVARVDTNNPDTVETKAEEDTEVAPATAKEVAMAEEATLDMVEIIATVETVAASKEDPVAVLAAAETLKTEPASWET